VDDRDTNEQAEALPMDEPRASASQPPDATPLSLLARLRRNDAAAWQQAVQLYAPLVRLWCRRAGLTDLDAEDVGQEVFAAAARSLADFHRDQPGDTFHGWLRGITRHQLLAHFRSNRGRPQPQGGSSAWHHLQDFADPLPAPDDGEQAAVVQVYLQALEQVRGHFEAQTWRAFWQTAVQGRSPAEVVDELGMSLAAIRQAKSRVLRRLKQEMGELLG
jgi:RNA polymerase sigma-70 factor (ECF subfamily)